MLAYLANGARLAVLLDPGRQAVEVYEPDQDARVLEPAGPVPLEPVLPGFTLDPAPIFSQQEEPRSPERGRGPGPKRPAFGCGGYLAWYDTVMAAMTPAPASPP